MLFESPPLELAADIWLLTGFALGRPLREGIAAVTARAPFRHLTVPGGQRMAVAMSNCGALGWTSNAQGYQYLPVDPDTGLAWPEMPPPFQT
jgi:DNA oxidative demethylase